MYKLGFEEAEESEIKLPTFSGELEKHLLLLIDYAKVFDGVDHNKLENSSRDGNTRPPYLAPGKTICRSRSNS